ncbi:MAG: hypothetical protein ISS72_02995 [Candidatus Brocadiae bacterium]|nr:hypothetical protein [Candidatus Brocadiia bacterium]
MDYEEAVAEFLSQPENFRLALEVAQRLEDAKRRVEIGFWHTCYAKAQEHLAGSEWATTWTVAIDPDENLPSNECGVRLLPNDRNGEAPVLVYDLTNWSSGSYSIYVRVPLSTRGDTTPYFPLGIDDFRRKWRQEGYGYTKSSVIWREIKRYEGTNSFLLDTVDRCDELASQAVDTLWDVFEETVADLVTLNAALRSGQ